MLNQQTTQSKQIFIDKWGYERLSETGSSVSRINAGAKFGIKLKPWQVVHHIDKDKLNNDLSNLYICSRKFHSLIHKQGIKKENFWRRVYALKVAYKNEKSHRST